LIDQTYLRCDEEVIGEEGGCCWEGSSGLKSRSQSQTKKEEGNLKTASNYQSINPSVEAAMVLVRSFVCSFVCSFILISFVCELLRLFVCSLFRLFIHLLNVPVELEAGGKMDCLFVHTIVCLFLCSSVRLFIQLFVHTIICLYDHLFVCSYVRLFVRLFVCLFIHSPSNCTCGIGGRRENGGRCGAVEVRRIIRR
jgi:hypothetical protein